MNTIGTIKEVIHETFLFGSWALRQYNRGVGRFKNLLGLKCVSQIHEIRVNPLAERVEGDITKQKSSLRQVPRTRGSCPKLGLKSYNLDSTSKFYK